MKQLLVLLITCLLMTSCPDQLCYSGKWTTKDITDGSTVSGTITFYVREKPDNITITGSDSKSYSNSASLANNDNGNGFGYKITINTTAIANGKTAITLSINNDVCDVDAPPPNPTTIEVIVLNE